jgi:hypothetical protein
MGNVVLLCNTPLINCKCFNSVVLDTIKFIAYNYAWKAKIAYCLLVNLKKY